LYLFLVCAAYFSRDIQQPSVSLAIFGPSVVVPGQSFPLRIVATDQKQRKRVDAAVASVYQLTDDGALLSFDAGSTKQPHSIQVESPPNAEGTMRLGLVVNAGADPERVVEVPIVFDSMQVSVEPEPLGLSREVPPDEPLIVDILDGARGLANQLPSAVWVRVTEPSGEPKVGAEVEWSAPRTEPSSGRGTTNAAGLVRFDVSLHALSTPFKVKVFSGGQHVTSDTTLHGAGRSCLLKPNRHLQALGESDIEVTIVRTDVDEVLYCDLHHGQRWLRTWHFDAGSEGPDGRLVVHVPIPNDSTVQMQCYSHYGTPGDGYDAIWLTRRSVSRVEALNSLIGAGGDAQGDTRETVYRHALPPRSEALSSVLALDWAGAPPTARMPSLRASTRYTDGETVALANTTARLQFFLWIGGSFGLVVLWALMTGIQSAIRNRVRLAEAIEELGELAVPVDPPTALVRARNVLQMLLVVSILVLNVVAMLALFQYM